MDADRWARWALLGDDAAKVPATLEDLHQRVQQAIRQAIIQDRKSREPVANDGVTEDDIRRKWEESRRKLEEITMPVLEAIRKTTQLTAEDYGIVINT